jgi:hypothetical protein
MGANGCMCRGVIAKMSAATELSVDRFRDYFPLAYRETAPPGAAGNKI